MAEFRQLVTGQTPVFSGEIDSPPKQLFIHALSSSVCHKNSICILKDYILIDTHDSR